ncbi:hypothetical protein [Cellulomonas carbonis]|uniref:hypothetical protein n=1 Tax=Cellulomonas carbonis TaxID=1386092 RepID=UPI001662977E|nr:hypothetical protein [Cellulomonas carbonis]GGC17754.1 hypothetical protein GCM10010972_33730 [Cellulomonas carbonis]
MADCGLLDFGCKAEELAKSAIGDAIDNLAQAVMEAFGRTVASLGTVWVNIGTPDLTGTGAGSPVAAGSSAEASQGLTTVLGYVTWVALIVAVISLFALGGLIAVRMRRGEGLASVGRIGLVLAAVVLISAASALVSEALPAGPESGSGTVAFLQSSLWWYMGAAAVLSVLIGAARLAWEQRAEPGRDLLRSLMTLIVVSGAGVTVVSLLVTASDSFSVWLLNNSLNCDVTSDGACFGENIARLLQLGLNPATPALGPLLVIILGLIAILASVVQIILMVARAGMLVILTGILPLSASATNTEMGRQWFKKCVAWLVAFVLYKPAAAVVYAAAFQLTGTDVGVFTDDGSGLLAVLTGLMLMVIALFAMPALMRFVTPMVGAMTAGGAGGAVAMGALAALPTGAIAAGRFLGVGREAGSAPMSGPTGSTNRGGDSGPSGSGPQAPSGTAATSAPPPGASGSAGGGASAAAGAGAGAGAGGASTAGAAGGPVGMAAGVALDAGMRAGQAAAGAARAFGERSVGEGDGPSGSR